MFKHIENLIEAQWIGHLNVGQHGSSLEFKDSTMEAGEMKLLKWCSRSRLFISLSLKLSNNRVDYK